MEAFGINIIWVLAYTFIFIALYFFSRKFINKVFSTANERRTIIEQGLKNAEYSKSIVAKAQEDAKKEREKLIKQAHKEAELMISKAREKETEIIESANKISKEIIDSAQGEITELKTKAKLEGLKESREIISIAINKAFEGLNLNETMHEQLIEDALKYSK